MSEPERSCERVARLDVHGAVASVRAAAGVRLRPDGICPGGSVGASYVRWPDGHRSVLTWQPARQLGDLESGPLATLEALRRLGYPAPEVELAVAVGDSVVLVSELLPGRPVGRLTDDLLQEVLRLLGLQAGALGRQDDVPLVPLHLVSDGPGFCLHQPLREHSLRTAALERRVREVAREHGEVLTGHDAVHVDFQPSNLLEQAGRLTGVVDWGGAGRGNRCLDLVTLRFGASVTRADDDAMHRLETALDGIPASELVRAWAHMSLRMVDWAIRHLTPADVDHWLALSEQRLLTPP